MVFKAESSNWITLFDFSGVKAMISLAAASTIQKIADSRIAIVIMWTNVIFILTNYRTTLTTVVFYISII
jgi:hypothetical protein